MAVALAGGGARPVEDVVPGEQRGAERAAGVARRRLDPEPSKMLLAQDPAVGRRS